MPLARSVEHTLMNHPRSSLRLCVTGDRRPHMSLYIAYIVPGTSF
jgi:hypothetical protein